MRVGTIYYDFDLDKTSIKWNYDFMGLEWKLTDGRVISDWLTHADALKDTVSIVENKYNEILDARKD